MLPINYLHMAYTKTREFYKQNFKQLHKAI